MYQAVGEETGLYLLVKSFYIIMETDQAAKDCLLTHELNNGLVPDEVKKKLFMFLCGWLGGPNLFIETYGPPRMKARHHHVVIGDQEREQWVYCMHKAVENHNVKISKKERTSLKNSFLALATRIQNT